MALKKEKACPREANRLGAFVCIDKQKVSESLADFKAGRKSKEEVEATVNIFFDLMARFNRGLK